MRLGAFSNQLEGHSLFMPSSDLMTVMLPKYGSFVWA